MLIRNMISDQLRYINIARNWFTISDLAEVRRHKIGHGRIGGKAAGMLLAYKILEQSPNEELKQNLRTPESYFLGSDLLYTFLSVNNFHHWNDQKYKPEKKCGGITLRSSRTSSRAISHLAFSSALKLCSPRWANAL